LFAGADINVKSKNKIFSKAERSALIPFVIAEYYAAVRERKSLQEQGIADAKIAGKYTGREKLPFQHQKFEEALAKFRARQITIEEAMQMSGIASRSTFYRRIKDK
jgi:hypothetical protein